MREQLEWTQALLNEQRSLRNRFQPRSISGEERSHVPSASGEPSAQTSAPRRTSALRNSQGSGDYRNSAAERDAPDLKSYLEPVNVKTDKELKSEIFNRK